MRIRRCVGSLNWGSSVHSQQLSAIELSMITSWLQTFAVVVWNISCKGSNLNMDAEKHVSGAEINFNTGTMIFVWVSNVLIGEISWCYRVQVAGWRKLIQMALSQILSYALGSNASHWHKTGYSCHTLDLFLLEKESTSREAMMTRCLVSRCMGRHESVRYPKENYITKRETMYKQVTQRN